MPVIAENRGVWDWSYSWRDGGKEWSRDWGAVPVQWCGTILPRIHSFLLAGTILEIGCGYGRWTRYLEHWCERLVAVDLSEDAIEAYRRRFGDVSHASFHRNDSRSLDMIEEASVDLILRFDAPPFVDARPRAAYLANLPRVLGREGAALLYHSDLGAYRHWNRLPRTILSLRGLLRWLRFPETALRWIKPGAHCEAIARRCTASDALANRRSDGLRGFCQRSFFRLRCARAEYATGSAATPIAASSTTRSPNLHDSHGSVVINMSYR